MDMDMVIQHTFDASNTLSKLTVRENVSSSLDKNDEVNIELINGEEGWQQGWLFSIWPDRINFDKSTVLDYCEIYWMEPHNFPFLCFSVFSSTALRAIE